MTIRQHDPHQGIDVRDADVATVDLGDPWTIVDQVYDTLKGGGAFVAICPTMNQIEKTAAQLKKCGYADIDCVELMIRNMEAREGMTRPSMRMIGHTTYLVFARKVEKLRKRLTNQLAKKKKKKKRLETKKYHNSRQVSCRICKYG